MEETGKTYLGYITAYRLWHVKLNLKLTSLMLTHVDWRPQIPLRATCPKHTGGVAPYSNCPCGIYGYNELHAADRSYHSHASLRQAVVFGKVALWGTIFTHELGYRAEYAYPLEFIYVHTYCCRCGTILADDSSSNIVCLEIKGESMHVAHAICCDNVKSEKALMGKSKHTDNLYNSNKSLALQSQLTQKYLEKD